MDENPANQGGTPDSKKLEKLEKEMGDLEKRASVELKEQGQKRTQQASVQGKTSGPVSQAPSLPNIPAEPKTQWPSEEKAAKSKKVVLVAVVLLLISIVGAGAYYFGILKQGAVATPIETPSPEPTQTPDLTANWETYATNDQMDISDEYFQKFPNFKNDIPSKLSFKYPNTWEIFKTNTSIYGKTTLVISLHKNDPRYSGCESHGPCENFAAIEIRIGMTDSTVEDFDGDFWGSASLTSKSEIVTINNVEVVQVFNTEASLFPWGSLFKIAPNAQIFVKTDFANFNDQNNETEYSKQTSQEINQILSTFEFLETSPSPSPTASPTASPSGSPVSGFGI